jgi:hypothetical protein
VTSETELWSLDSGNGRCIRAILKSSETSGFSELELRWDDGEPVRGPIQLTDVDCQNLVDLLLDHARKHGIEIKLPQEELHLR